MKKITMNKVQDFIDTAIMVILLFVPFVIAFIIEGVKKIFKK